ncbi:MAG: diguanylate cyclase [Deltaproteobacteria bacterium]|nr:diguanylate cyclase [Deltaproteobacteria bacterium]
MPAYALIAEADSGQAELLRHLIASEGVEAEVARDGLAAKDVLAKRGAPSLLVCDLSLPRLDGFQLLAELRKAGPAATSPAVVVCAFPELRDAAGRMRDELGILAVHPKSASPDTLRRSIKRALAQTLSMRAPAPGAQPPPAPAAHNWATQTDPRIDLRALEQQRLAQVSAMGLVDDLPVDKELATLLEAAAAHFNVRAAIISLALSDKHWFKAHHGLAGPLLDARSVPKDFPFLRQVVETNEPLVVPDATSHPVFSLEPMVKEGALKGFAAAPLAGPDGEVLGCLVLLDDKPLPLDGAALDRLIQLARRVAGELQLRAAQGKRKARAEELQVEAAKSQLLGTTLAYLDAVLDNLDDGVYVLDSRRRVAFINRALASWLGREPAAFLGDTAQELRNACAALFDDPQGFLRRVQVPEDGPFALREEFDVQRPKRRVVRWVARPISLPDGVGHLGIISDITAEADLLHEREMLARTDPLTGLANRRGGEESIQREVSRSERGGIRLSFALFDLDEFRKVNQSRGHSAGDDALRAVARVLLSAMRGADLVVRWGGDELLAVLPSTGLEGAKSFAERVRAGVEALEDPVFGKLTLSSGVAELHQGEDEGQAMARAEAKLLQAKSAGRNRVM